MARITRDVDTLTPNDDLYKISGGMTVLFFFLTCGIFGCYWACCMKRKIERYKASTRTVVQHEAYGYQGENYPSEETSTPIIYALLFFVISIVSLALLQSDLNEYGY